jgi:hypothetical protein
LKTQKTNRSHVLSPAELCNASSMLDSVLAHCVDHPMLFRESLPVSICKVAGVAALSIAALIVSLIFSLTACGNSNATLPPIVVTFDPDSPPPASLETGAYAAIAATVTNDNKNAGVSFSCVPNMPAGACGTFTPAGPTGSNVPVCYLAPGQIPTENPVTVTATSVTDPTKSVSAKINIVSGAPQPCP